MFSLCALSPRRARPSCSPVCRPIRCPSFREQQCSWTSVLSPCNTKKSVTFSCFAKQSIGLVLWNAVLHPSAELVVLSAAYRVAVSIDISPSSASVDPDTNEVSRAEKTTKSCSLLAGIDRYVCANGRAKFLCTVGLVENWRRWIFADVYATSLLVLSRKKKLSCLADICQHCGPNGIAGYLLDNYSRSVVDARNSSWHFRHSVRARAASKASSLKTFLPCSRLRLPKIEGKAAAKALLMRERARFVGGVDLSATLQNAAFMLKVCVSIGGVSRSYICTDSAIVCQDVVGVDHRRCSGAAQFSDLR